MDTVVDNFALNLIITWQMNIFVWKDIFIWHCNWMFLFEILLWITNTYNKILKLFSIKKIINLINYVSLYITLLLGGKRTVLTGLHNWQEKICNTLTLHVIYEEFKKKFQKKFYSFNSNKNNKFYPKIHKQIWSIE